MFKKRKDSFIIKRKEELNNSENFLNLYDLKNINCDKEKFIITKNKMIIPNEERIKIIYILKKLILSSYDYFNCISFSTFHLIIILNLFFILKIIYKMYKEDIQKNKTEDFYKYNSLFKNIVKTLLSNIIFFLMGNYFFFKNCNNSNKIQKIIFNFSKLIINDANNDLNSNLEYNLLDNLSILIRKKTKKNIIQSNIFFNEYNNLFNYFVLHNLDITDKIENKNIIPVDDRVILENIYSFIRIKLYPRFNNDLKNLYIPSFACIISFLINYKKRTFFNYYFIIFVILNIIVILIVEMNDNNIFKEEFKEYIKNYNKKLKSINKYIYTYKTLIIIFTLNENGKKIDNTIIKQLIDKYIINS